MPGSFSHLNVGAVTDVGVKRKENQDSIVLIPEHGVFCVADGMGGAEGGAAASQSAVACLSRIFEGLDSPDQVASAAGKARLVDRSLNEASREIKKRSDAKGIKGAGTTAVVITFDARDPGAGMIAHAGDSRAYRFRDDKLVQLSKDHTVAAAAGIKDETQLPAMFKGVVTRAVGVNAKVEVEMTPTDVKVGDVFLLSSDGLDKLVPDEDIAQFIREYGEGDLQALAQRMMEVTNSRGGVDNVSVILVRVGEADPATLVAGTAEDDELLEDEPITVDGDGGGAYSPTGEGFGDLEDIEGSTPSRDSIDMPVAKSTSAKGPKKPSVIGPWLEANKTRIMMVGGLLFLAIVTWQLSQLKKGPDGRIDFQEGIQEFSGEGEAIPRKRAAPEPVVTDPEAALKAVEDDLTGGDPTEPEPEPEPAEVEPEPERPDAAAEAEAKAKAEADELAKQQAEEARQKEERAAAEAARVAAAKAKSNRAAFGLAVADVRSSIPKSVANVSDLDRVEIALDRIKGFQAQQWPDIEPDEAKAEGEKLHAELATQAEGYVSTLGDKASFALARGRPADPAVAALRNLATKEPVVVSLASQTYANALKVLDNAMGQVDARAVFDKAVSDARQALSTAQTNPTDASKAERAVVLLNALESKEWVGVPAKARDEAVQQLRAGVERHASGLVDRLSAAALTRLEGGDAADAEVAAFEGVSASAPSLAGMVEDSYAEARTAVTRARDVQQKQALFQQTLERCDQATPAQIVDRKTLAAAETAVRVVQDAEARTWDNVTLEEKESQLGIRRAKLEASATAYITLLRDRAIAAYTADRDGSEARAALAAATPDAPLLMGWVGSSLKAAVSDVDKAHTQWENKHRFTDAHDRISRAIPTEVTDEDGVSRAEKAASALALMSSRDWPDVPPETVSTVQAELRTTLRELAATYVDGLQDQAAEAYLDMQDGSGPQRTLQTLAATAPSLAGLVGEEIEAADRMIAAAAKRKAERDAELAADEARREAEAKAAAEQDRLAAKSQELDDAQSTFPEMVAAALASGDWEALETQVKGWDRTTQSAVGKSKEGQQYDAWLKAWKQAKKRPKALSEELVALQDVVAQSLTKAGLEAPAVALPPADASVEAQATAYCAARNQLQEAVVGRVVKSAALLQSQGQALGEDPAGFVMNVWAMAGRADDAEAKEIAAKLARAREALAGVSSWGESGLVGPATAEQLKSAPVSALATADEAYDAAWDGLYHVVDSALLDSLNDALTYGGFMGLNLNKDESAQRKVKAVENVAFEALDARDAFGEKSIRDWRQNADPKPFLDLIQKLRDLEALIPAAP